PTPLSVRLHAPTRVRETRCSDGRADRALAQPARRNVRRCLMLLEHAVELELGGIARTLAVVQIDDCARDLTLRLDGFERSLLDALREVAKSRVRLAGGQRGVLRDELVRHRH